MTVLSSSGVEALQLLVLVGSAGAVLKSAWNGYLYDVVQGLLLVPQIAEDLQAIKDVQEAQLRERTDEDVEMDTDAALERLGRSDGVDDLLDDGGPDRELTADGGGSS